MKFFCFLPAGARFIREFLIFNLVLVFLIMKIFKIIRKFLWQILGAIFIILIIVLLYQRLTYTFITAEFSELRPLKERINVFYKGYKVGKVLYVKPGRNYETSHMRIALFYNKNLRLPNNITVKLQREKDKWRKIDYVEIVCPKEPSETYLKNNDIVSGKSTVDIETFLSSQETDSLDNMKENLEKTVEELHDTIGALNDLFATLNEMAEENRNNFRKTTNNLEDATRNIDNLTKKLNRSIKQENLNKSMSNLEETAENVKNSTSDLKETVKKINEFTNNNVSGLETSVNNTEYIIGNLNEITCGVKNTLKKRFGGIRLLFGKTIQEDCIECKD